jgi:methylphosphotriester-DNA--protein-cysteine methyltransferase
MGHIALDPVAELRSSPKFLAWHPGVDLACEFATEAAERHYTPQELAKDWRVSVQTVREIFKNEPGVLKIGSNGTRTRRRYKTLRIPESVVERVHTRLSA